MGKKLTIEFIRAEFVKEGYKLLTKVYKNAHQKLDYTCPEGKRHNISWTCWQRGHRCSCYSNSTKLTIEFVREEFRKEDYILLSNEYINSKMKLDYICSSFEKHHHSITWSDWKSGYRCPYCAGGVKQTIEFICIEFAKENYILLSTVYVNNKTKLDYICPQGHYHGITWNDWNSKKKYRCPFCSNHVSKWEKEVKKFLTELNINYIPNDRTQLINPNTNHSLELDLWMPKSNKAIECNGVYWHSKKLAVKKDKIKKQLCEDQEIDLLVITDEEWNEDIDKCKRKLTSFVGGRGLVWKL